MVDLRLVSQNTGTTLSFTSVIQFAKCSHISLKNPYTLIRITCFTQLQVLYAD